MARRALWIVVCSLLSATPAFARDAVPATSSNVELVRNVPLSPPPDGGRLVGRSFYVTSRTDLKIFDVTDPENPGLLSQLALPAADETPDMGWPTGYQEDVDTNGRILIRALDDLVVVDVSDPRAPREIGRLPGFASHTVTCVLDCTWVYSSFGEIVDLRDPRRPVKQEATWKPEGFEATAHDLTEVAPGLLLNAGQPMLLLDAREDPTRPEVLASTELMESGHGTHWPNQMRDRFVLAGGESAAPQCSTPGGPTLSTYDTTGWRASATFKHVDSYEVPPGVYADGRAAVSTWCAHWFDPHPSFRDGGPVAMAWYENGTRFVQVGPDGRMQEAGWFLPLNSYAYQARWISERIVYSVDQYRGLDILRFTGEIPPAPAAAPSAPSSPAPAARPAFADLVKLPRCAGRGMTIRARGPVRSLRVRIGRGRQITSRGGAVRLKRLPRRRFTLTVEVTTRDGSRLTGRKAYRRCAGRR